MELYSNDEVHICYQKAEYGDAQSADASMPVRELLNISKWSSDTRISFVSDDMNDVRIPTNQW